MSLFTWETFIPEINFSVSSIKITLLNDITDFKPIDDENEINLYFSLDFEETKYFENYILFKENPIHFFEFKNSLSTRNKFVENIKNYNRTYISYIHDSVYKLIYMVKDFDSNNKYQVIGMDKPETIYNPFNLEPYVRPRLNTDFNILKDIITELCIYWGNIGNMYNLNNDNKLESYLVQGMFNIHSYVITFIILTYNIYTSENKPLEDVFYDNLDFRKLIFSKINNIVLTLFNNNLIFIPDYSHVTTGLLPNVYFNFN